MKRMLAIACLAAAFAASPVLADSPPAKREPAAAPSPGLFTPGMRSVKIEATNFERSAAFYTALGMKVGTRREATWDLVWEATSQNSGIVMTTSEYAARAHMVRGGTYMMIMTPDVKAATDRLRAAGFADVPQPRVMGTMVSFAILHDPDGNQIELMGPLPRN